MNDYIFQQELEALAGNAVNPGLKDNNSNIEPSEPTTETTARWQKLFSLAQDEAVDRVMAHRNDLTRTRVSDEHWDMIRAEQEAQGYDREAYEYELELQRKRVALTDALPVQGSFVTYLVGLNGPLDDLQKVQKAAGMTETPLVVSGESLEDHRSVWLCCMDGTAKANLLRWAADEGHGFEPTILVNPKSLR